MTYLKRVKNFFELAKNSDWLGNNISDPLNSHCVTTLHLAETHIIKAHEHKIYLAKNIIKNNNLLQDIESDLKLKKSSLELFKIRKNKIRKRYQLLCTDDSSSMTQIESMEEEYYFLDHEDDIEYLLIEEIDRILNKYKLDK